MIRLIRRNLKGYALVCAVIAPLMMLVEVLMDLQQPTLMSDIVDIGVARRDLGYVTATGLQMFAFALVGFVGGSSNSFFASIASANMSARLREMLFGKVQSLSFAEIDRFKTSSLVTRLTNDVVQMQSMLTMLLRVMVRSPIICLGGIVMAVLLIPELSPIFIIVLPLIIAGIVLVLYRAVPLFMRVQSRLDRVNTVMRENLLGVRVVKTFGLERRQLESFGEANGGLTEDSVRAQGRTIVLMPVVTLVMNFSVVAVLWFGGNLVISGGLPVGKIMAFVNYLVQITNSLMMAVNLVINLSRAQASASRINEVLAAQPSVAEPARPSVPAGTSVEFEHVSFRYRDSGDGVLRDISFRIGDGQTLGIIGATGSGKSTLVGLIPRLYDPEEGCVRVGGVDVRTVPLAVLRREIGLVMQESTLFSGTVRDNLLFGREEASEEEIAQAVRDAQAFEFIDALPEGLMSPVEQRGKNFSGGQKQRLSIARTLLANPGVLILDDSTSAVDLATESRLHGAIGERMAGSTVIVIAQRISAVMHADRILVLDNGRVSALGTHEELLRSSEVYRSIVVSQLGEEALAHAAC